MNSIGYACMHAGKYLGPQEDPYKHRLTTGRTCRASTRQSDFATVGQKALENIQDLRRMLLWNIKHDIRCLRVSALFPWLDTYNPTHLPNWSEINLELERCHNLIETHGLRITTHPGQYVCLASPNPSVVQASIREMNSHGLMFDLLGLPQTPWSKINIHIGGTYVPKGVSDTETESILEMTAQRFADAFSQLHPGVRQRLTLENDDKSNGWSIHKLHRHVLPRIQKTANVSVPLVFDSLHWEHGPKDATYDEALSLALTTWGDITPMVHHSQSAWTEQQHLPQNQRSKVTAHSKRYTKRFHNPFGQDLHVMLECKDKELAALDYLKLP
jgi:UV DNA damage endonuclease